MTDTSEERDAQITRMYEVGYLILPSVPEENIPEKVSNIKNLVTKDGGKILSEGYPEMRELAYEMTKNVNAKNEHFESAYFGWMKFECTPSVFLEMKKSLDLMVDVLRYILIKAGKEVPVVVKSALREGGEKAEAHKGEDATTTTAEIDKSIDELVAE